MNFPILSLMLGVPLVAALVSLFASPAAARKLALAATLLDFVLGLVLWSHYQVGGPQWQFTERLPLFAGFFNPDRWLLWLGLLFVLSVYYFPTGVVGRLRAASRD